MTPTERAQKIAKLVTSLLNYEPRLADTNYSAVVEELKIAFEAAQAEAYDRGRDISLLEDRKRIYAEGFCAALDKAKEIVSKEIPGARSNSYGFVAARYEYIAQRIGEIKP